MHLSDVAVISSCGLSLMCLLKKNSVFTKEQCVDIQKYLYSLVAFSSSSLFLSKAVNVGLSAFIGKSAAASPVNIGVCREHSAHD